MSAGRLDELTRGIEEAMERPGIGAALRLVREAVEELPREPRLRALCAQALLWTGDLEGAEREIAAALDAGPECAAAFAMAANYCAFMGDSERALAAFERARGLDPEGPETLLAGINVFSVIRQPGEALAFSQRLYELRPDDPAAWSSLMAGLHGVGDSVAADKMLRAATAEQQAWPSYHVWMTRYWQRQRNMPRAEACARRAVELAPESDRCWTELATSLEYQGKHQEAEAAALKAEAINSRNPVTLRSLASLVLARGDEEAARAYTLRADYAVPALAYHGKLYPVLELIREGEPEAALELALATEREAPADFCDNLRGTVLYLLTELERWEELEGRLAGVAPSRFDADCYAAQAALHASRGELREAVEVAEEGHLRFPEAADLAGTWIRLLAATGQGELLRRVGEELAENPPAWPVSCSALVEALEDAGEVELAVRLLQRSLEMFPEAEELRMTALALVLGGADFGDDFLYHSA